MYFFNSSHSFNIHTSLLEVKKDLDFKNIFCILYIMKTFIYYNNLDPSKEPQGKVLAGSISEAKKKVAQIKDLPLKTLNKIFKVTPQK